MNFRNAGIYYKAMQTKYGKIFLVVLFIFITVFAVSLIYAQYKFEQSQNRIKNLYVEHIEKADSLYLNLISYNKDIVDCIQNEISKILTDSIITSVLNDTQNLSYSQSDNLCMIFKAHFNEMESIHQEYNERLLRDSLRLNTERELLNGQTKTMIDLHLDKIEHEYSNITIWAAVLTIIFLVFSFYSIFKIDELIQQGDDGVKEIRQLKKQGQQTIDELNVKGNKILEDTGNKLKILMIQQRRTMEYSNREFEQKREELDRRYNESVQMLTQVQDQFNASARNLMRGFETQIEEFRNDKEKEFDTLQREFRRLVEEANSFLNQLKSEIKTDKGS